MKRLTDAEKVIAVRRLLRQFDMQVKPLLAEMEAIVSASGEISPEEKEIALNKSIAVFFEAKSLGTKRALVLHALHVMSIDTVRQLTEASRADILRGPGMGEKTLQMVEDILASYDLSIKKD